MADITITLSAKGQTKLTSILMQNTILTDKQIAKEMNFLKTPTAKEVNSDLFVRYHWKKIGEKKVGFLMGMLFLMEEEMFLMENAQNKKRYGILKDIAKDFIEYNSANYVKQQTKNRKRNQKKVESAETQRLKKKLGML